MSNGRLLKQAANSIFWKAGRFVRRCHQVPALGSSNLKNAAELYRLHDLGTISDGKSADFVILDSNPLEDIKNTRAISNVYIRGQEINRAELSANWTG